MAPVLLFSLTEFTLVGGGCVQVTCSAVRLNTDWERKVLSVFPVLAGESTIRQAGRDGLRGVLRGSSLTAIKKVTVRDQVPASEKICSFAEVFLNVTSLGFTEGVGTLPAPAFTAPSARAPMARPAGLQPPPRREVRDL